MPLSSEHGLDSEKIILQSVLLDNDLFHQVERLKSDDFQHDIHRKMFDSICERIRAGEQIDEIILASSMSRLTAAYIEDMNCIPTRKIEKHVEEVLRASQRRQIIRALQSALAQAQDASEDNASVLSVTQDRLLGLAEYGQTAKSQLIADFSVDFYARMEGIADGEIARGAITTGLVALDEMTTGFSPTEYIIVGAYTGEGKTSFATQIIAANCRFGIKCLLFSQEMSKTAVLARLIPQVSSVPAWKMRNPKKMSVDERKDFAASKALVDAMPLWVNDASTLHSSEIVSHSHTMVRKHGIQLIVVDYLQLMKADGEKRYDQVSAASAALRELAKSLKVVVIGVSQLARPEGKLKRAPGIWDLKASGELENDAHMILFPFRPVDKKGKLTGKDFIIIGKQREGALGRVPVVFDSEKLIFKERQGSEEHEEEQAEKEGWWQK